jgi:NADPH:quinone reductase-like Zn-dependent oxidoreductase
MYTTRLIRFDQTGGPGVLRSDQIPLSEPKGNEVLIRVEAIRLSRIDFLWREGRCVEHPVFPAQIGYDATGTIEAVGPKAVDLKVGDRVSTLPAVSLLDYGAHGEAILYPDQALLRYPGNLSPLEAAAVNTGLFTLVELADLQPGQFEVVSAGQLFHRYCCPAAGQNDRSQNPGVDQIGCESARAHCRRRRPCPRPGRL